MLVLAEISDKLLSAPSALALSIAITLVAVGVARLKWWLATLALPVFALWNWSHYTELHEPFFGALIRREMGAGYIAGLFASINIPPASGAVVVIWLQRAQIRRRRRSKGLCVSCGYPPPGRRCPECGAFVTEDGD